MESPANILQWPSAKLMGAEFVSLDEQSGTVEMAFTPPAEFANMRGSVQGGLLAGPMDEAMGAAVYAATNGGLQLTLDINLSLMRPVPMERITVKAKAVKTGRRVTFVEAELFDHEGKLCARATATTMMTGWPGAEKGPDA
ncbi:PaaI family thioesterase [Aurantiacibacter aquimixticola]|uniref:PaaI family thioesterase n=1 Tax=Aurantiacibacter aquimixticola TaxID=1958945 RepID=A0A419RQP0_9SPHN|nr:PaaI family thioesterase [Aurantiacibacter aquimixticola]RJY08099.1 PaaI family thioesterase [Aurantiacibacter aquimixticola]